MASKSFIDLSGLTHYDEKLNEKFDAKYVSLTGDQTISGAKTFTASPAVSMPQPIALLTNPNLTKGTNPSSNTYGNIMFQDKTSTVNMVKRAGSLDFGVNTSGQTEVSMRAFDWGQETNTNGAISIYYPKSGTPYTAAPTPASSDNSTKIATTAFVKAQGYLTSHQSLSNYVTLDTAQTITGTKTFSGDLTINQCAINATVKDTNSTTTRTNTIFKANSSNTSYGINTLFGSASSCVIGAGEGKETQFNNLAGTGAEDIYLVADGSIHLKPNANTFANVKEITVTSGGGLTFNELESTRGTAPSGTIERCLADVKDSASNRIGLISTNYYSDMSSLTSIWAYKTTAATGNNIGNLGIGCDASGGVYTIAPTPSSAADNSTKIATTAWVRNATGCTNLNAAAARSLTTANPSEGTKLYYTVGQPAIGTAAGNAYKGSSSDATLLSFPDGGTVATTTNANVQNIRMMWANSTNYFTDIFVSPNNHYIWHRNVMNGTAYGWRRMVEENVTGVGSFAWNISIAGNAGTATKATQDASGNVITATYATKSELPDISAIATSQIDALFA